MSKLCSTVLEMPAAKTLGKPGTLPLEQTYLDALQPRGPCHGRDSAPEALALETPAAQNLWPQWAGFRPDSTMRLSASSRFAGSLKTCAGPGVCTQASIMSQEVCDGRACKHFQNSARAKTNGGGSGHSDGIWHKKVWDSIERAEMSTYIQPAVHSQPC